MKVFFSYGHEHQPFVQALAQEIKRQSNGEIEPWFDAWDIKEYSHWRAEITKGILESRGVVAFLSEQGLREGGVCLDELAIAITSKYGMIKSVLLDKTVPETNFMPPAMLAEYQWADMSDYRNQEKLDEYIKTKAAEIVAMLTSDELKEYNQSLAAIRKKLGLPEIAQELSRFDKLINTRISGRKWLNDKISLWLRNPEASRILMLYGKPGSGKSLYAAHLSHYNPYVAATIACNYQSDEFSNTERVIDYLAYRLALRLPDYRNWLITAFADEQFQLGSGYDRFNQLITQPLSKLIDGSRETMLVVIDGLDEMKNTEFATFIAENIDYITPKLRFLITSRKEAAICNQYERYQSIDLSDYEAENEADLREYFSVSLEKLENHKNYEEFLERLVVASEGVFTYAECVCNNILEDYSNNSSMELANYPLPKGIMQLFKDTFDRRNFTYMDMEYGKLDYQGFWQIPLGIVLFAPSAIPKETLMRLMNWRSNAYNAFMRPLGTFIEENNGRLRGFHKSFGEWLDKKGDEYATSKEDGVYNLARGCYRIYKSDINKLDEYMLCNLTKLLREAGFNEEYEQVINDEQFEYRVEELLVHYNGLSRIAEEIDICEEMVRISKEKSVRKGSMVYKLGGWYQNYADVMRSQGAFKKAQQLYGKSLEIFDKLMEFYPDELDYKAHACNILCQLGGLTMTIKGREAAFDYYKRSLELGKELLAAEGDNSNYQHIYCLALIFLGEYWAQTGKSKESFEAYCNCLGMAEKLYKREPDNLEHGRMLSACLDKIGDFYSNSEMYSDAEKYYKRSIAIAEILTQKDPDNMDFKSNLAMYIIHMGDVMNYSGRTEEAIEYYNKGLQMEEKVVQESQGNYIYQLLYSHIVSCLGDLMSQTEQNERAIEYYTKSIKILEELVDNNPQVTSYSQLLGKEYESLGYAMEELEDYAGAMRNYFNSLRINEQIMKESGRNYESVESLCWSLRDIASCYQVIGDKASAREFYEKALKTIDCSGTELAEELADFRADLLEELSEL